MNKIKVHGHDIVPCCNKPEASKTAFYKVVVESSYANLFKELFLKKYEIFSQKFCEASTTQATTR